jgi:mannose-6-phosphate isomerase
VTLYPLTFDPIFKERIWGGRTLASLYGKTLPPDRPIGESWEISDRPGDESAIANGPLAGRTVRWLMERHRGDVLGSARPADGGRFPLLCKILDARDRLSLQVHPPQAIAGELGGEPKTEMWYIADAGPGAELYAGLRPGVTRESFEARIASGDVAECFHRIPVAAGDTMFLPSGRVHAIGAGLVIFEIQQNSDTTYRVFDWNRLGLDGRPRDLHVPQSLRSIDFTDVEPSLVHAVPVSDGPVVRHELVRHPLFGADLVRAASASSLTLSPRILRIVAAVRGRLTVSGGDGAASLSAGDFCLVPASIDATMDMESGSESLVVLVA